MKMIINKKFVFGILVFTFLCSVMFAVKIQKSENKEITLGSEYVPQHSPTVIRELMRKVKKLNPKDSDVHDACLDLMLNSKNGESMKKFWDALKVTQTDANKSKEIPRQIFKDFIESTNELVIVDGVTKSCKLIVGENLMELSEIQNISKQRELQQIIYPYFPSNTQAIKGKNIVTAFIGVHRDSDIAKGLIPKLNGRS